MLLFTASVLAGGRPIMGVDTVQIPGIINMAESSHPDTVWGGPHYRYDTTFVDTTRYYAKVDTVVLCSCAEDTIVCPPFVLGHPMPDCGEPVFVFIRLDTTWLPKVQVWLTLEEIKTLKYLLQMK
jgi:hypothetical protein